MEETKGSSVKKPSFDACFTLPLDTFTLDVDISLPFEGVTAVFGPSGSGKTSLLRCIAGLERPAQGRLVVGGQIWQDDAVFMPTHQRSVAYVFQEPGLFPHMTVAQNLAFASKRADLSHGDGPKVDEVINACAIGYLLKRFPRYLSGGEKQRVAIARALLVNARCLLMDEPIAALDVAARHEILSFLEVLCRDLKTPIFYVSHSVNEVMRLADRMLVMDQGKVVSQGGVIDILGATDAPWRSSKDRGVVIEASVTEKDTTWQLAGVSFDGNILWLQDQGYTLGETLRLQLMAKDISLANAPHRDTSILNILPATVIEITDDADNPALALVTLALGNTRLLAQTTRRSLATMTVSCGQSLWVQVKSVALIG